MSLIKEVINEVKNLDVTGKSIKKFGLVVSFVFLALSALLFWQELWQSTRALFLIFGILLVIGAIFRANSEEMKIVYRIWMGLAFFLGWIMSRVILTFLFYLVVTPIGFIAKLFGKKFIDLKFKSSRESYWVNKENKKTDFEKMF